MANNGGNVFAGLFDAGKWALTVVPKAAFDFAGHEDSVVDSTTKIVRVANDGPLRKLIKRFLKRFQELIDNEISERFLEVARRVLITISNNTTPPVMALLQDISNRSLSLISSVSHLIDSEILLKTAAKLTRSILDAVIKDVGALRIIREGILSNDVNAATLKLLWGNGGELANFFVDLVECMKCYAQADSWNGAYPEDDPHGQDNELDLRESMNRHAAICQFQRLAKSVVFILKEMAVKASLDNIDTITATKLMSDVDSGLVINVPPSGRHPAQPPGPPAEQHPPPNEKWLFVNGIAGEYYWLYLACRKLAKRYSRDITGVFNRGDGILWDLVECAGERTDQGNGNASRRSEIVQRTKSSMAAQESLKNELEKALRSEAKHVVMIAHSQGCLLLRLALQELLTGNDNDNGKDIKTEMKNRLCIFTFGNPSLDWKAHVPAVTPLESLVLRTEHFANKTDFVAKLGVLRAYDPPNSDPNTGYPDESVFINRKEEWKGHLFGSQYSLNSHDYRDHQGPESWLLACGPGRSIRPV
jgi:hypothetical protein